jgi:cytoskeleton protein RodZ
MSDRVTQPQTDGLDLAAFGEELSREREIRGISLKEISDATKISRRFLEALEKNEHRSLPAPVFTRGFVREYARYVGLDADEMVNRYNTACAHDDRIEKPPQIQRYPDEPVRDISPKPPRKRGIPHASVDWNAIALLLIAAALAGVAWWAIKYRRHEPAEPVAETTTIAAMAPKAAAPATQPDPETPAPTGDDTVLRLTIDAVANSWVVLDADGKTVVNAEIVKGERREVEARDQFRFRTVGNAAGIALTLNGTEVPVLGADGEVVKDRVFDRKVLEQLRAAPPADEPQREPS